jgi:hypothetical protein
MNQPIGHIEVIGGARAKQVAKDVEDLVNGLKGAGDTIKVTWLVIEDGLLAIVEWSTWPA